MSPWHFIPYGSCATCQISSGCTLQCHGFHVDLSTDRHSATRVSGDFYCFGLLVLVAAIFLHFKGDCVSSNFIGSEVFWDILRLCTGAIQTPNLDAKIFFLYFLLLIVVQWWFLDAKIISKFKRMMSYTYIFSIYYTSSLKSLLDASLVWCYPVGTFAGFDPKIVWF